MPENYDDLIAGYGQAQAAGVQRNVFGVADGNPDKEAGLQALAKQYGVPVDTVRLNQADYERRAKVDSLNYDHLVAHYPATTAVLGDPNKAAIAHDDVPNLTAIEGLLKYGQNVGRAALSGVYGFSEGVAAGGEMAADFARRFTAPLADSRILPVDIGEPLANAFHSIRQSQTALREHFMPQGETALESGIYSGVQSLSQNLLTVPFALASGNPELALNTMALNTGGQSYGKARDLGASPERALLYGAGDAAIEYGTEALPLQYLFKDVQAGSGFFKTLTHQLATEIPGEQAATALQDLNEWASLHPEKTLDDYLKERPDAALQTLAATVVGSGGQVGVLHLAKQLMNRDANLTDRAEGNASRLEELAKLAESSRVLERNPEVMRAFVDHAAEGKDLYIDAQAFMQSGIADKVGQLLPDVAEQLPTALATGGEVRIPVADYVTQIAPVQAFHQSLLPHVRMEGEEFSQAGAAAFMQERAATLQTEIQSHLLLQQQQADWQDSVATVHQAIYNELNKLDRFAPAVSDKYAQLFSAYFSSMAQRMEVLPNELYQSSGLNFSSDSQPNSVLADLATGLASVNSNPEVKSKHIPFGSTFQQTQDAGQARGAFDPATRTIFLHQDADLSTVLHEAGHFFLELQFELAKKLSNTTPLIKNVFQQAGRGSSPDSETDLAKLLKKLVIEDMPPGRYATQTRLQVTDTRELGTDSVNSPADAAQAFYFLAQYANEHFEALLTDKHGKPLAVVGALRGARRKTPFFPEVVAAEAFRVKGAANIWFVHNHPSAQNVLSYADRIANAKLSDIFNGSKIAPRGMLAIAGKKDQGRFWVYAPPHDKLYHEAAGHNPQVGDLQGFTQPVTASKLVPVLELVYTAEDSLTPNRPHTVPLEETAAISQGQSGVLFMSVDGKPTAFMPVADKFAKQLRKAGRMDSLHRAVSVSNANLALIINQGDLSTAALQNLAGFFHNHDVKLMDVFDVQPDSSVHSQSEHRSANYSQAYKFFQSPIDDDPALPNQLKTTHAIPLPNLPKLDLQYFAEVGHSNGPSLTERMDYPVFPPGLYAAESRLHYLGTKSLGVGVVNTPAQAARAFSILAESEDTQFVALLTDAQGQPVALINHFLHNQQFRLQIPDLLGTAFRIKNVANIWFFRQRPDEAAGLTHKDRVFNYMLAEVFRGSQINLKGYIVFGQREKKRFPWAFEPAVRHFFPHPDETTPVIRAEDHRGAVTPAKAIVKLPLLETQRPSDVSLDAALGMPVNKKSAVALSDQQSGIFLIDRESFPQAFIPLPVGQLDKVRGTQMLDELYRALSLLEPVTVVIINHNNLTEAEIENLTTLFHFLSTPVCDVLDVYGDLIAARAQKGDFPLRRTFKQTSLAEQPQDESKPSTAEMGVQKEAEAAQPTSAAEPSAKAQILADTQTLLDWFGLDNIAEWYKLGFEEQRRCHELFAQGFERYLLEGKAPSLSLQNLFEHFKAWLMHIYGSLTGLHDHLNAEVRAVFDRLLASDAEIRQVQAGAEATGRKVFQPKQQRAVANVLQRWRLQKVMQPDVRQQATQLRQQLSDQMDNEKIYQAWQQISQQPLAADQIPVSFNVNSRLRERGLLSDSGRASADLLAEHWGYRSGTELLHLLATVPSVADRLEQELHRHYAQLQADDSQAVSHLLALHAIQNGSLAEQAQRLAIAANSMRLLGDSARQMVLNWLKPLALRRIVPADFARSATEAARHSALALRKGDQEQAAQAKYQQLFSVYAFQAASVAQQKLTEGLHSIQLCASADFSNPVLSALLAKYQLATAAGGLASLANSEIQHWLKQQQNLGLAVEIAPFVYQAAACHYLDLTQADFQSLVLAVQQMAYVQQHSGVLYSSRGLLATRDIEQELLREMGGK